MVVVLDNSVPLVYILVQNKQKATYDKVFSLVKNAIKEYPKIIVVDFEKTLIEALYIVFKTSKITGCIFHFGQTCWRKLQSLKLSADYKRNERLRVLLENYYVWHSFPKN
jgi:hypothetical protein